MRRIVKCTVKSIITVTCIVLGAESIVLGAEFADEQRLVACITHSDPPNSTFPPNPSNSTVTYQQFPADGALQTAWYVTFDSAKKKALFITGAYFKTSPNRKWIQVLGRAGLSELYVPYQSGNPRFYDFGNFDFDLVNANPNDAGGCGKIIGRDGKVVREIVDKGPLWKNDQMVFRGQKLILWGTLDAANYNYIVRYEFHDDGTIKFRVAGTAVNLPYSPSEPHMHNALWRIDVNLNGASGDSVNVLRHLETVDEFMWKNVVEPFNSGKEGSMNFVPTEFTQVQVIDINLANGEEKPPAYDLRPLYRGVARHKAKFMRSDFWVTVNKPEQQYFPELQNYVNNESIVNADVVLWHVTPLLHVPRSEDGGFIEGHWKGVALAMWGGFDMRPRNLFGKTPFYP